MTAMQNPTAMAMIDEMIADNDRSIRLVEQTLALQLSDLEHLAAELRGQLEANLHIEGDWLRSAAHKAEESISKRRALYETKASLAYVMKAAGGE